MSRPLLINAFGYHGSVTCRCSRGAWDLEIVCIVGVICSDQTLMGKNPGTPAFSDRSGTPLFFPSNTTNTHTLLLDDHDDEQGPLDDV